MSKDRRRLAWHRLSMRDVMTPEEFEAMFIERTKALREHRGMTSADMATALGIPVDRYRKYESRTTMPHELLERFALIVGVTLEFLVTGRRVTGKGPYPDVPGPHCLDEWRAARAKAKPSKRGRPPLKK